MTDGAGVRRIAVVGGGLAGLAAARELKAAGARVDLYERSRLLGGRATSFEVDGRVVDNGQHVYLACCSEFIRFVSDVGMAGALHTQECFHVVVFANDGTRSELRAASLPAPLHLLASFAGYAHLPLAGKLQIARALIALSLRRRAIPGEQSFAQWLRRNGQSVATMRAFWEPFLVPALNAPLDRMSAREAAFVIATAFLTDRDAARFGYSRVPLAQIMERAAEPLDAVHRSCAVLGLDAGDRITLHTARGPAAYDAAVLAVSPRALSRIVGDPARYGVPPLDGYDPFAILDVHLWHGGGRLPFDFAALLDSPVQWVFQKADGYLCCSVSDADALVAVPTAQLVQQVWEQVRRALGLGDAPLVRGAATRNPEGTYLPRYGTERPSARTALPNLTIAGAWTATGWPDTMESAVRSGLAAARTLLEGNDGGTPQPRRAMAAR